MHAWFLLSITEWALESNANRVVKSLHVSDNLTESVIKRHLFLTKCTKRDLVGRHIKPIPNYSNRHDDIGPTSFFSGYMPSGTSLYT